MFEKFILKYFSENSFLELANASFNEAGVYFGRNTEGGIKALMTSCRDEALNDYFMQYREAMLEQTKTDGCNFIVALPYSHKAFPAPFSALVDQSLGEVAFLCGFERVFREREEKKSSLTENERSELTAVIKILACACRAQLDWSSADAVTAFLQDKDACNCVGYDIVSYFRAYELGFTVGYLKSLLDCIPVLQEESVKNIIALRAGGIA